MRVMDILFAFPSLVLAIAITGLLGASLTNAMIAIGIVYAPLFARVARGPTLSVVEFDYVQAARALGAGEIRILVHHVLPNVAGADHCPDHALPVNRDPGRGHAELPGPWHAAAGPSWGTMLSTGASSWRLRRGWRSIPASRS